MLIKKVISSELLVLSIGKLLQMLLLFVAIKLFTTYLSDKEVGNLILFIAISSFFGLAAINPIGSYLNRKLYDWVEKGEIGTKLINYNYYVIAVSLVSMIAPIFLLLFGVGDNINTLFFSLMLFIFVYFTTWNQTIIPTLNLLLYRKAFIVFTLLTLMIYIALSTTFVIYIEANALMWVFGQSLGLAIGFMIALIFLIKFIIKQTSYNFRINWSGVGSVVNFGLPLSIATLFLWVLGNSFKVIIEAKLGAEKLAYIGLGLTLATSLAGAVESLLMQVFHAHFYKGLSKCKTRDERSILFQKFIDNTIPPISAVLFILMVVSPYLVSILAHERFSEVYIFLMAGLVVEFFRISTNIIGLVAHSEYKTKKNIPSYLVGGLFALLAVYLSTFSESWELYIVLSLLVSWMISLTLMILSAKKMLVFKFPWRDVVKLIILSSPVILFSWLFWNVANSILISILMIFLSGCFVMLVLYLSNKKNTNNA